MKVYRLKLEDGFIMNWVSFHRTAFPLKCQDLALAQHFDSDIASSTSGSIGLCLLKCSVGSDCVHSGGGFCIVRTSTTLHTQKSYL